MRMLGRFRSVQYCCPGHTPAYPKWRKRRAKRMETRAWKAEALNG